MSRWSITVSSETDKAVRTYIAQTGGKKGDLSLFIEKAVQKRLFELAVDNIKMRNSEFPQQEILSTITEAQERASCS